MEFWQYILVFIVSIVMALFLSISLAYLNIRFIRKDDQVPFSQLLRFLFRSTPRLLPANAGVLSAPHRTQQSIDESDTPQKRQKLTDIMAPELADEFEYNRLSAALFSGDRMLPLQTAVWDAHQDSIRELPVHLRDELEQFYTDIKTLNKLVWFSVQTGYQGYSVADYQKLLDRIVQEASKIKSLVASGFPE